MCVGKDTRVRVRMAAARASRLAPVLAGTPRDRSEVTKSGEARRNYSSPITPRRGGGDVLVLAIALDSHSHDYAREYTYNNYLSAFLQT